MTLAWDLVNHIEDHWDYDWQTTRPVPDNVTKLNEAIQRTVCLERESNSEQLDTDVAISAERWLDTWGNFGTIQETTAFEFHSDWTHRTTRRLACDFLVIRIHDNTSGRSRTVGNFSRWRRVIEVEAFDADGEFVETDGWWEDGSDTWRLWPSQKALTEWLYRYHDNAAEEMLTVKAEWPAGWDIKQEAHT